MAVSSWVSLTEPSLSSTSEMRPTIWTPLSAYSAASSPSSGISLIQGVQKVAHTLTMVRVWPSRMLWSTALPSRSWAEKEERMPPEDWAPALAEGWAASAEGEGVSEGALSGWAQADRSKVRPSAAASMAANLRFITTSIR